MIATNPNLEGPSAERRWRIAAIVLMAALGVMVLLVFRGFGTTWDEELQRTYGDLVLSWFGSLFHDREALEARNLFYYGPFFDVLAQLATKVSPLGVYETRHLMNAAFGLLGVFATWRIGALLRGERAGFASALFLALIPAWIGHSFANPKDVPFAALATLALWYVLRSGREAPRIRWSLVVKTGLALGAALAVRAGGAFVGMYLLLYWGSRTALALRGASREQVRTALRHVCAAAAAAGAIAWTLMVACWPWAQISPLTRPFEAIALASRFPWNGYVRFEGQNLLAQELPRSYLPTWLAITLPDLHLVVLAAGAVLLAIAVVRRKKTTDPSAAKTPESSEQAGEASVGPSAPNASESAQHAGLVVGAYTGSFQAVAGRIDAGRVLEVGIVAIAAFGPIAGAVVLHPVLYDGQRHFLFVLPPLAALAGLTASALLEKMRGKARWAFAAALCAGCAAIVVDVVELHPYEYVYFNRLVAGGLRGAAGRFETDYWGASYRAGTEWVLAHFRGGTPERPMRLAGCAEQFLVGYWIERDPVARERFVVVDREDDPDVFLATTRWDCHEIGQEPIHIIERQGVPLLYIYSRYPPDAAPLIAR